MIDHNEILVNGIKREIIGIGTQEEAKCLQTECIKLVYLSCGRILSTE
jgi:hypothetical protein